MPSPVIDLSFLALQPIQTDGDVRTIIRLWVEAFRPYFEADPLRRIEVYGEFPAILRRYLCRECDWFDVDSESVVFWLHELHFGEWIATMDSRLLMHQVEK